MGAVGSDARGVLLYIRRLIIFRHLDTKLFKPILNLLRHIRQPIIGLSARID